MSGLEIIGLTANIIQFVEFGHRIINNAARIYQSPSGTSVESDDFELSEDIFDDARKKIESSSNKIGDEMLLKLCESCKIMGDDLSREYVKLKEPYDGKQDVRRKLRCLWKATKGAWGSDYIEAQKGRLEKLKNDLNFHVLVNLRSAVIEFFETFPRHIDELNTLGRAVLKDVMENRRMLEEAESRIREADRVEHKESRRLISETRKDVWHISETFERKSQSNCLSQLPFVDIATFDNHKRSDRVTCLKNTRVEVLQEIVTWADSCSDKRVYWLTGFAGSGKSTIARTIAHRYEGQRRLAATFFFSKTIGGDARRSHKFVTSIAYQIAQHSTELRGLISQAMELDDMIIHKSLLQQWQQLILKPLTQVVAGSFRFPILIIVDALDECEDYEDTELFVSLLAGLQQLGDMQVRTLITSRPDITIREGFYKISKSDYEILSLQNVSSEAVDDDIRRLFCNEFEAIRKKRKKLPTEWPGADIVKTLVERSGGLFIWADTACRFVREGGIFPQKRISKLHEYDTHTIAPDKGLDMLYLTVLKESISPKDASYDEEEEDLLCNQLRTVLGTLVTSLSTLSIFVISRLTELSEDEILDILDPLHSILEISGKHYGVVKLHHPSFRDFLVNGERCVDVRFLIDESQTHADLASGCIKLMFKGLRRDMCNLSELGILNEDISRSRVKDSIHEQLEYACQYWVDHVQRSGCSVGDNSETFAVLKKHFLHWLEALSLTGKLRSGIESIKTLITLVKKDSDVCSFISDALLFLRENEHIVDLAPLQLYCSSLPFTPRQSRIYKYFDREIPCGVQCLSEIRYSQEPITKILYKHKGAVEDLKFSPNGNLMASSGYDESALLWDPFTGDNLKYNTVGLKSPRLLFSPDNASLALVKDNAIQIAKTDVIADISTPRRYGGEILGVAFTADSKLLAICISDGTVIVLDIASCEEIKTFSSGKFSEWLAFPLHFEANLFWMDNGGEVEIDRSRCSSVGEVPELLDRIAACWNAALKMDGRKLLVISSNTIRLFKLSSGDLVKDLYVDVVPWYEILISPRLEYFFGRKNNKTIEIWSIFQREMIQSYDAPFKHCSHQGTFSKDNRFLATPFGRTSIGLLDLCSKKFFLLDCRSRLTALTFSPDITCLAAGNEDGVVCLWDIDIIPNSVTALTRFELDFIAKERPGPFQHFSNCMGIISLPQHESIAINGSDETVAIRHMTTGKITLVLENLPRIRIMEYSPVQDTLIISFDKEKLGLYELDYGTEIVQVSLYQKIRDIIISKDGKHLILDMVSSVQIRNALSLELVHSYKAVTCGSMAISNGSKLFAIGIEKVGIEVWDLAECKELFVIGLSSPSNGLTFSTDDSMMAYMTIDSKLTLYGVTARETIWTIYFDRDLRFWNFPFSFAPNDATLAICNKAGIHLFNVESGKLIGSNLSVPEFHKMNFSADGDYIDTQLGQFKLTSLFPEANMFKQFTDTADLEEGYYVLGEWLMKGSNRFLWLPPGHRGNMVFIQGKSIAIRSNQGRLTILSIEAYQPEPW